MPARGCRSAPRTDLHAPGVGASAVQQLRALRDDVKRDGADFGILVFPFRLQVEAGAPPPRPQAKIQEFCAAEGVPCLDLLPALSRVGEAAFVDYDHFTPLGSELVADEILLSGLLAGGPGRGTGSGGSAAGDVSARAEAVRAP